MYCPSCGAENEEGAKFCQACGANMAGSAGEEQKSGDKPPPPAGETPQPSAPPPSGELDIGGWISKGFSEVFSGDFGSYLVLSIVVTILSMVTLNILGGPLLAGSLRVIRRKLRGEGSLDVGVAVSEGFGYFVPSFVLVFVPSVILAIVFIVLNLIPGVGQVLWFLIWIASCILVPFYAISLHYVTEENKDFMPAAQSAVDVMNKNPVMYWLFGLLTAIIAGIGGIVCGIGALVTVPVSLVMLAYMLESQFPPK